MKQKLSDQIKYVLRSDPLIDEAIALEQELDAARLEVERLRGAIEQWAANPTTGNEWKLKEALAAQKEAG